MFNALRLILMMVYQVNRCRSGFFEAIYLPFKTIG